LRLAAIIQGVYKRGLDGIARSELELEVWRERAAACARKARAQVEAVADISIFGNIFQGISRGIGFLDNVRRP